MNKVAILADTHFGARNDSIQFNEYFEKFYTNVFFPRLRKEGIKTIIHVGDVFDRRKYVNFQILWSCKKYFFDILKAEGIELLVIPGNHDTYYKNTNEINSLDLLLREYDNIKILHEPTTMKMGNVDITTIPWMCAENYDRCIEAIKTNDSLLFGHFEIDGFYMFRGIKNEGGLPKNIFERYSSVYTGHFHHRSQQDNITYLGSPYEITWADYNDPRGFHILTLSTKELEFIENPYKMFHKIYYNDSSKNPPIEPSSQFLKKTCIRLVVEHKSDYSKFEKFVEKLYQNEVIELIIFEDFSEFETEQVSDETMKIEDTMTLLSDYVDGIETMQDKDKVKKVLKTLYVEAQNLMT